MAKSEIEISVKPGKDAVTVVVAGDSHFDLEKANDRVDDVVRLKPPVIRVDASKLTFISSTGICFLISLRNAAKVWKGRVYLEGLQPHVQQALQHARVMSLFDHAPE